MEDSIKEIKEDIKEIKEQLLLIVNELKIQAKTTKKMDEHINFVEDTYETLRSPLNYIASTYNNLVGKDIQELPQLTE